MLEQIKRTCADQVHVRILSDTSKRKEEENSYLLEKFERLLFKEAKRKNIDIQ